MTSGPSVQRHATSAQPPTSSDLAPPPMIVDKSLASPEAATAQITANAEKQNMINNIAGGGRLTRKMKKKIYPRTCKCKCKCCMRLRMRRSRKHSKRKLINKKQRQIVSKRIQMNLLHRKIRKSKNNHSYSKTQTRAQHGGESTVPQHGVSCTNPSDQQCPGNSTESLLDAQRQATVNEQGDKLTS